jgi:hypothetical protein
MRPAVFTSTVHISAVHPPPNQGDFTFSRSAVSEEGSMTTIVFDHSTLIQGKMNNIDGGVFDASIDDTCCNTKDNAELTIYMRVHFYDGYYDAAITSGGKAKDSDDTEIQRFPGRRQPFATGSSDFSRQRRRSGTASSGCRRQPPTRD